MTDPKSITKIRHNQIAAELPSYADMHEMLGKLAKLVSPSQGYIVTNLFTVLEQSAKLITTDDDEKAKAEEQLNEVLR